MAPFPYECFTRRTENILNSSHEIHKQNFCATSKGIQDVICRPAVYVQNGSVLGTAADNYVFAMEFIKKYGKTNTSLKDTHLTLISYA
jgi:hypothetical protein